MENSERVTITEFYIKVRDRWYMESSLHPGRFNEVPVVFIPPLKADWIVERREMDAPKQKLLDGVVVSSS